MTNDDNPPWADPTGDQSPIRGTGASASNSNDGWYPGGGSPTQDPPPASFPTSSGWGHPSPYDAYPDPANRGEHFVAPGGSTPAGPSAAYRQGAPGSGEVGQVPYPAGQFQPTPYGQAQYGPGAYGAPPGDPYAMGPQGNGMAVAALVLGITSIPICCLGWLLGPLAIIFGAISKKNDPTGKAKWGLILGCVGLGLWLLWFALQFAGAVSDYQNLRGGQ